MIIRSEKPSDIEAITQVTEAAFENHEFSQQTEHFIIRDLRKAGALTLSLVAEIDRQVVGQIAFSPVTISDGTTHWYGLGPVSVLPDFQGCRIGTKLVKEGLARLIAMAGRGCVLVGFPTYYDRFGFHNFPQLIYEEAPEEVFVAKPLSEKIPSGVVEFHEAFKQLSVIERDTVSDVIVEYDIGGAKLSPENPAIESLIEKDVLIEMPDGRFVLRPLILEAYDAYFARVYQFRATEMSRVHKNPIMSAIRS